ncbi:ABC transporter ATP-binding protein [Xanthobacter dioxanivorans]|uniref:ABC transporter ATP-binding protein n=2 Tax=Xanthobacter dioxanivorans TaxID=2528964 RepID=A0A974PUB7_9HYPH|nr:ABC transporter ATP-binding protein [Xanthobacter dioxanivorans]
MTSPTAAPKVSIRDVCRTFSVNRQVFHALADINLEIRAGEFLCLVGPSGCGKSTLLRMLGGLDQPSSGTVSVRVEDSRRPTSAIVFQQESVFPWLTVERNATYAVRMLGLWNGAESQRRVDYFLERCGLSKFRDFYPHQLSGGMKQRLSIVRAFSAHPELLLMDEPFAALDEQNKLLLQQEVERLWEDNKISVLFITHSLDEAILLGDRVAVMSAAPGRIKETIDIPFERPRNLLTLKSTPEFGQLYGRLWDLLGEEVMAARKDR